MMTERPTTLKRLYDLSLRSWRRIPSGRDLPVLGTLTAAARLRHKVPAPGGRLRIVLIADRGARYTLQRWLRIFRGDDITVFADGFTPAAVRGAATVHPFPGVLGAEQILRSSPALGLVADLRRARPEDAVWLWRRLGFMVADGGVFAARAVDPVAAWPTAIPNRSEDDAAPRDVTELLDATVPEPVRGFALVLRKTRRHLLTVDERLAPAVLRTRDPELDTAVLTSLPAAHFDSRARTTSHTSTTPITLPEHFEIPTLAATRYRGDLHHPGEQVLWHDHTVLPPSVTVNEVAIVRRARTFGPMVALPDAVLADAPRLDGDYFDLDVAWLSHFGHFMTEIPAKLWAWREAKRQNPGLRALFTTKPGHPLTYERELFQAFGITDDDLVHVDRPVRLESFVSAAPMFHNTTTTFIHPGIQDVWDELRDRLRVGDGPRSERLFVTRPDSLGHRRCRNARDVERSFADAGFDVVSPESMTLTEQASLFAGARVIAGFGGSAMFNLIFADRLERTIVLNHESYTARNEHLITTVRGGDAHFFWSPADRPQPENGFSDAAFHSGWEFDVERNGAELDELLRDS